jgi:hypothetical protein
VFVPTLRISPKSITRFSPKRSAVSADVDHWAVDADEGLIGRGLGGRQAAEGAAREGEPVGVMHRPVEDGVPKRGVADHLVPVIDRELAAVSVKIVVVCVATR